MKRRRGNEGMQEKGDKEIVKSVDREMTIFEQIQSKREDNRQDRVRMTQAEK